MLDDPPSLSATIFMQLIIRCVLIILWFKRAVPTINGAEPVYAGLAAFVRINLPVFREY